MPAADPPHRRADLERALKAAKADDMLSLDHLAMAYGTSKSRFVTVMRMIPDMPAPVLEGTRHIYPARASLKAMLGYVTRNDQAADDREKRQQAILGGLRKERQTVATGSGFGPRDLQILNRMATELDQRERDQRLYIPAAEVAMVAGDVFSEISEFMASLSNKVDPNGLLDPKLRQMIDENGASALLGFHKRMKDILDADVDHGTDRRAPSPARKPRTRRKRA